MRRLLILVCVLRGHRFDGWEKATRDAGVSRSGPLPMVYCGRCGAEL